MSRIVELTVWERVTLFASLDGFPNHSLTLGEVAFAVDALKKIAFTDDEQEQIKLRYNPIQRSYSWDVSQEGELAITKIEFTDREWQALQQLLRSYRGWPVEARTGVLAHKLDMIEPEVNDSV